MSTSFEILVKVSNIGVGGFLATSTRDKRTYTLRAVTKHDVESLRLFLQAFNPRRDHHSHQEQAYTLIALPKNAWWRHQHSHQGQTYTLIAFPKMVSKISSFSSLQKFRPQAWSFKPYETCKLEHLNIHICHTLLFIFLLSQTFIRHSSFNHASISSIHS